jgi:hypothetical protein
MTQLRVFRNMAESHVERAIQRALTAAADPNEFIDESFIDDFITVANGSWSRGIGVVTGMFGDLPAPLYQSIISDAVKDSAEYYRELLVGIINKKVYTDRTPINGEFLVGNTVQYGDVRPILSRLGGGSTEPGIELVGGITSGRTMTEWLRSNGIDTDKKIWLYGYEDEPRRVFNGHLQMDGLVFEDWEDDGLRIAPQDAWLRRSHYRPGDHFGCACVVAPYIPNFGEEYQIDTAV